MGKITGRAVEEEWGSTLWINGDILQSMCPILKKYFQITRGHFLPTLYYCELQLEHHKVGDTVHLLKRKQLWRKYAAGDYEFPLIFGNKSVPDFYNDILEVNPQIQQAPVILWTFWLLAYFVTATPVKEWLGNIASNPKHLNFLLHIKPDMIKLQQFIQGNERYLKSGYTNAQPITITTAYGTVRLDNFENYFWDYIRKYIDRNEKYLNKPSQSKPGKQKEVPILSLTVCLYNFFYSIFNLKQDQISTNICRYILMFFEVIQTAKSISLGDYEELQKLAEEAKDKDEAKLYQRLLKYNKPEDLWLKTIKDRIKKYKDEPEINRIKWPDLYPE